MIEVLITLVIASVALLSSAGLQLQSKRSNYDSAQRTTAAHLAEDLLERMRSNPQGLLDYTLAGQLGGGAMGTAPATDCGVADCTATELAGYDLWNWEQVLDGAQEIGAAGNAGGLAFPTACITGPGFGANGVYTVAIAWRGTTGTVNPGVDPCGATSGSYGAGNEYRRILVVRSYISAT